ncbi:beta-ketoacyl-[acyl-carrier-protein] synthase family protein [Devosia sp. CAU 1758]
MKQVAITGYGAISAAGLGTKALWRAAVTGTSQVRPLSLPRGDSLRIRIAASVQNFDPTEHLSPHILLRCDRFTQFAHVAAEEALRRAGMGATDLSGSRTAVIVGTGIGGMNTLDDGCYDFYSGKTRAHPLSIPRLMPSSAASHLSIQYGATGPCFSVSSACSSAAQAIGLASQMIRAGIIDRALVGGSEACLTPATIRAWEVMRVLSPDVCRPFAKDRHGMILGEGAGILVLESETACQARGGVPLAWLAGYGTSSDARDIIQPDVRGPVAAMRAALEEAGLPAEAIGYINAHGTGTVRNDIVEAEAIGQVFGPRSTDLPVSSSKPVIGHTLGASGALEFIIALMALRAKTIPPHINMTEQDPSCPLSLPPAALETPGLKAVLSNSFAFGGVNATLLARGVEA